MESWTFRKECEREGLDPRAVRRVIDALARGDAADEIMGFPYVSMDEYKADQTALVERERDAAADAAETQHAARIAKAYDILCKRGPADPHAAIILAFNALRKGCEDYSADIGELLQICIDDLDNTDLPRAVTFSEYVAARVGARKWVVGSRITVRQRCSGYTVLISRKRYASLEAEYAAACAPRLSAMIGHAEQEGFSK